MQRLRLNKRICIDSTGLRVTLWSLFLLIHLCVACSPGSESERENSILSEEIELMHRCQQKADNLGFYVHKYRAERVMEKPTVRYSLVLTDYLMQVGSWNEARAVMDELAKNTALNLNVDTALWLDYLCHQGEVNYIPFAVRDNKDRLMKGYDCLIQCYMLSLRKGFKLYKGISMKMLSRYMLNDSIFNLVRQNDPASVRYINEEGVADSLLAGNLAERALCEFLYMNEPYHTADSWRSYALCFFHIGNAERSVECLHHALANPAVDSIPALKAAINQQMSMSYAALNDKRQSDKYRNAYLDIQESIRQDKQYEARVMELRSSTMQIWYNVAVALIVFLILCAITALFNHMRKKREKKSRATNEEVECLEEEVSVIRLKYSDAVRAAVEQRARVAFVSGMLPLVDRMRIATKQEQWEYTSELAHGIVSQNELLTSWIKLRQGKIVPKIEIFRIQDLFDVLVHNSKALQSKGITLKVGDTDVSIKADAQLTLFMLNTIVDNACKALAEQSGVVSVSCAPCEDVEGYAEVRISDNGKGMSESQVRHLFDNKPIMNDEGVDIKSHGFGLQNCRGIIEKYKKISSFYSDCAIWAKSVVGKGTVIGFRLPLALKVMLFFVCMASKIYGADGVSGNQMKALVDSVYDCNVEGRYNDAMSYAEDCHDMLNKGCKTDSATLLSLYNETAVAALALHDWNKYLRYNYKYTLLYQACTVDKSLPDYCEKLQSNKLIADVAMIVSILLLLAFFPIFWFVYLRHVYRERKDLKGKLSSLREQQAVLQGKNNTLHIYNNVTDNQLSALKHETMYYPSRITQMINTDTDKEELTSVVNYYRELYALLLKQMTSNSQGTALFPVVKLKVKEIIPCNIDSYTVINKELITYLLLLIKRHNGNVVPGYEVREYSDNYYEVRARMSHFKYEKTVAPEMFTSSTCNADFLIMRQIIRETGAATHHLGCGIRSEVTGDDVFIAFTLPRV